SAGTARCMDGSSAGTTTVKPGSEQASETSSMPICDGPSSPMLMPACVPTTFTSSLGNATDMRNWSYALHMTKQAKLASQARLPDDASPAATPTRFDSAMPTLKKRSGNFLAKCSVRVELLTSPSRTTISGYCSPSLANARPKASRVDLPVFMLAPQSMWSIRSGANQLQCFLGLLRRQWLAVMVRIAAEQFLDWIAFHGACNDDARFALGLRGLLKCTSALFEVVAFVYRGEPAERFPAWRQRSEIELFRRRARLLIAVLIDNGDEIVELELLRRHRRFPDLPFIHLAV